MLSEFFEPFFGQAPTELSKAESQMSESGGGATIMAALNLFEFT